MFHITESPKMSQSVVVINPHCVSKNRPTETIMPHGQIKKRELPPADKNSLGSFSKCWVLCSFPQISDLLMEDVPSPSLKPLG